MGTNRIEAFSDGVIAVIITIMVLELKPPDGFTLHAWEPLFPAFLVYALSFVVVAIIFPLLYLIPEHTPVASSE